MNINSLDLSKKIRILALRMVSKSKSSHIGSCLSIADLLGVLYSNFLRIDPKNPLDENRDRFLLSKGHAAAIMYAVLAEKGFFDTKELDKYGEDDSIFLSHVHHHIPGVEWSTGSLGHALSVGVGQAYYAKISKLDFNVVVLLSDGELNEGSNWEAILFAAHHQLNNLIVIVDYNKIQSFGPVSEVLELHPLKAKWDSFNWDSYEVDGHSHEEIKQTLDRISKNKKEMPHVVIANTTKGKGVSFMEDKLEWHYRSPSSGQLENAIKEIEENWEKNEK